MPNPPTSLHHVGCAVESIERSLREYRDGLGFTRVSEIVEVSSQKVLACFVETAPKVYVELVEPTGADSPVQTFLRRRQRFYHLCYGVADVEETARDLQARGFWFVTSFHSEAFSNDLCAFLMAPDGALLELCRPTSFTLL